MARVESLKVKLKNPHSIREIQIFSNGVEARIRKRRRKIPAFPSSSGYPAGAKSVRLISATRFPGRSKLRVRAPWKKNRR